MDRSRTNSNRHNRNNNRHISNRNNSHQTNNSSNTNNSSRNKNINNHRRSHTSSNTINNCRQNQQNNRNRITDVYKCILCKKYHALKSCRKFLRMDVPKREQFVEDHRYCINCLARSHDWRACPSMERCKKCDAFHHSLLHPRQRSSITTKQLRQRKRRNQVNQQQPTTTSAVPNTVVISEAIKSLAAVLCSSGY